MRVSVVLLLFSISCAELQRGDDQPAPEDVQPRLNRIQNQSHVERPELLTDQTTSQPDVWTELRELRDMVVEQRVKLQYSERQIEELKKENAETLLFICSSQYDHSKITYTPKVAFSFGSGLSNTHGPFNVDTMLVFRKEFINIGNAYSPNTGVFTAPLRGVYFFRLNVLGSSSTSWTGGVFFKNQEQIFYLSEYPIDGINEYASNAVSLLLEKGDLVYVKLLAGRHIRDNILDNYCTFNGFLLFPM
uniref:C1q domain-containing protein n=1 Tax=Astyanax mexicanus TaxID=7994 RepID=A0A8B9KFF2_ASTMX